MWHLLYVCSIFAIRENPFFRFCYSTSAKSHYPRVQSVLMSSDLPKMFPPSSVHLSKSQLQQMRDWRIKHGQSVPQKTVRNVSTKDNPGTLSVNLYLTEQSTSQTIDFCAIGQSNEGSATGKQNPIYRVHSRESIVYLASDASSNRLKLYVLQEDVTSATKKARAVCFDNDPFNRLIFTQDTEKQMNAEDICGVVTETFLNNRRTEMTEQEFVVYQSTIMDYVDSVTIDEARKCLGEDDMQSTNTSRRSTRSRKRNHLSEFMYCDD